MQGIHYYFASDIFQKVVFFVLLDMLHRRSKLANFCHDLMQNHVSYRPMYKTFHSSDCVLFLFFFFFCNSFFP